MEAGYRSAVWDGRDSLGREVWGVCGSDGGKGLCRGAEDGEGGVR